MTSLGRFNGKDTFAYDINDSGQVVGYSGNNYWEVRSFIYTGGTMVNIGT
ncbi:MAG: HAF repeat-containing protein, partial [Deltaproteobacteria bacterium]|nr:HAF repeat-containing protein [Deltaproteobacteria bacterium]